MTEVILIRRFFKGNVDRFFEEVLETMNALLAKENGENPFDAGQIAKMRLEINASRLTNNVSVDDSAKSIFFAFLRVQRVYETFAQLKRVFGEWMPLWRIYFKRDVNKLQMLHAIEVCFLIEYVPASSIIKKTKLEPNKNVSSLV